MYVKAYLDLSLKSLVFSLVVASGPVHLGAWPGGSWLPWRAVPFFFFFAAVLFVFVVQKTSVGWSCSTVSRSHLHNGLRPN